jgi:hypothetical protein
MKNLNVSRNMTEWERGRREKRLERAKSREQRENLNVKMRRREDVKM